MPDTSAHRIISDLSAFIGHRNPAKHRILAAGDLNMSFGVVGDKLSIPEREQTVWDRMSALGLEVLGPQWPNACRMSEDQLDVAADSKNVPTFHTSAQNAGTANRQLDYVFASRGFHEKASVFALNSPEAWGSSDHCRIKIDIDLE